MEQQYYREVLLPDRHQIVTGCQSNLTKGCIATTHGQYSPYFTMGHPFPVNLAPSRGISGPPFNSWLNLCRLSVVHFAPSRGISESLFIYGSSGPPESTAQRASRSVHSFCRAHDRDRQTGYATVSCNNRLHLHSTVIQPNNWST